MKGLLSKQDDKWRFACIGTVVFARKVNLTMLILMKTFIFICRGRHEGIANVETDRNRQGQTGIDKDKQGHARTVRDRQGQTGTSRDKQAQQGNVSVCSCLSMPCPCMSLLAPGLSLAFTGIIGKKPYARLAKCHFFTRPDF